MPVMSDPESPAPAGLFLLHCTLPSLPEWFPLSALRSRTLLITALLALATQGLALAGNPRDEYGYRDGTGGINAPRQQDKPYLVLVSIDGFRWDYPDLFETPALDAIAARGVRAERLIPVWPTLTFPNHYSIATGLYPARHGLVANTFRDPASAAWYAIWDRDAVENGDFYAGQPIWVTAESQGMVTAAFFFVGSEAAIRGIRPSHWRRYDKSIAGEARVDQVLEWLALPPATRPHLYTLYFEDVDDNSHWYGPGSEQAAAAIERVDGYLVRLLDGLDALPHGTEVNLIVVSDHGQREYLPGEPPLVLTEYIDLDGMEIIEGGSYAYLYFHDPDPDRARGIRDAVNGAWSHGRAWLPEAAPASWRLGANPRYPDVIVQPDPGYAVISTEDTMHKVTAGDHGWAPEDAAMHGIFLAAGPAIRAGARLAAVDNVDVYPLMVRILGLEAPETIDGDLEALRHILRDTDR
jgi:predicted AlkP superfamily pyrophosphatase or phosphodiesterase